MPDSKSVRKATMARARIRGSFRCPPRGLRRRATAGLARHDGLVIQAVLPNRTPIAERLGLADAPAVQDERVGGPRPSFGRHYRAKLLLDGFWIIRLGDADPIRHAQHVPIDRKPGDAELRQPRPFWV